MQNQTRIKMYADVRMSQGLSYEYRALFGAALNQARNWESWNVGGEEIWYGSRGRVYIPCEEN